MKNTTEKQKNIKQGDKKSPKDKAVKTFASKNLETEPPLAEKDEVKKAEERTMKRQKKS